MNMSLPCKTLLIGLLFFLTACATYRPCSDIGDLTPFGPPLPKNTWIRCEVVKSKTGAEKAHGPIEILDEDGKILVRGQLQNGKKQGRWIQYDQTGKVIADKKFEESRIIEDLLKNSSNE